NMTYEQIPRNFLQRLAPDRVSVVTPVGRVGLWKTESPPTRYEKLHAIMLHLERAGEVGTDRVPRKYFRGKLELRSGTLPALKDSAEMVCYSSFTNGLNRINIVMLVGSLHHVVGGREFQVNLNSNWDSRAYKQGISFSMPAIGRTMKEAMDGRYLSESKQV